MQQYERGVLFRFGRVRDGTRGIELNLIMPVVGRLVKVNLQITTVSVPAQDGITRDSILRRDLRRRRGDAPCSQDVYDHVLRARPVVLRHALIEYCGTH